MADTDANPSRADNDARRIACDGEPIIRTLARCPSRLVRRPREDHNVVAQSSGPLPKDVGPKTISTPHAMLEKGLIGPYVRAGFGRRRAMI